ncbi:protein kinase [Hamiltosporidium tvaerminnensis]|uniref:Protein kinase n=1 Tax=Hamiltosporidium tvaerminnensis TaxID=1176355 RepID=A0A4Q9L9Y7_9MICR|nr:protein kinase [Hamiltosporidium tvaerminnensis]
MNLICFWFIRGLYFLEVLYAALIPFSNTNGRKKIEETYLHFLSCRIYKYYSYTDIEYLSSGGYGHILKATYIATRETVVIKVAKSNEYQISLTNEKSFLDKLNHLNIIKYIREIKINNKTCLVFPFYENTLESAFLHKFFDDNEIRFILKQILDALRYMHNKGIIHNDIKPGNVLLQGKGCVKIIDFGISCNVNRPIKIFEGYGKSDIDQKFEFYSPEIRTNDLYNEKSDMWSFGYIIRYLKYKNKWKSIYELAFKVQDYSHFISFFINNESDKRVSASTALMSNFFEGFYEFIFCFCSIKDQSICGPEYKFSKFDNRLHITNNKLNIVFYCGCSVEAKSFCSEKIIQAKRKDMVFFNSDHSQYFSFGNHCSFMIIIDTRFYLLCELNMSELECLQVIFQYLRINTMK